MKISVKVKGTKELQHALKQLGDRASEELGKGLYAEGELIMTESKKQCPVDTGTLRGTGHVEKPEMSRYGPTVTLGYGGPAAPYAVYVHEDLTKRHNPPTKAKYLEDPAKAATSTMPQRLVERLRRNVLKG